MEEDYLESAVQRLQLDSPRGDPDSAVLSLSWGGNLTALFSVDGDSCDVLLTDTKITWKSVTGSLISNKSSKKKKKSKKQSIFRYDGHSQSLLLKDIYAVKVKRRRKANKSENEGICIGMAVFTYQITNYSKLRERVILFEHPSEVQCTEWVTRIEKVLNGYPQRPKRIKLFLQPYAGTSRLVRKLYKDRVVPLLEMAKIVHDTSEITLHKDCIRKELEQNDLGMYDCIIVMGGDGSVSKVLDAYLSLTQQVAGIEMKAGFTPHRPALPLGVIPTGTTNHLVNSVQGIDDITTAVFHIIFGNTHPVDVCSSYQKDKFNRWSFNLQYGFGGNILHFTKRYTMLGQRKIDAAFLKALTKSKLRPYECDIKYIPSPISAESHPKDGVSCKTGCAICLRASHNTVSRQNSVYTDSLQEFDPLANSGTSSTIIDLTKESPWRSTKGAYLNVALFTVPSLCEYAPQGLSKYTHLADGYMDLVLVRNVERKHFLRYLKRHGNSKNQFDFPFVECHRVKEVQFRPRMNKWNHKDHKFSEIDYEMTRVSSRLASISEKSLEVIDDHGRHSKDGITDIDELSSDDEEDDDTLSRPNSATVSLNESNCNDPQEPNKNNTERVQSAPATSSYRPSLQEQIHAKYQNKLRKKEEKAKEKEESRVKSVWNIDNEVFTELDLDVMVHSNLLLVYGQGIHPNCDLGENTLGCIPHF